MKRRATLRKVLLVVMAVLSIGWGTIAAEAFPMKYIFNGVGAFGDVNGIAFDDVEFRIQILGDTANVNTVTDPTTPIISNLKGSMTISGPGIATVGNFTNLLNVFAQHTSATQTGNQIGFGEAVVGDLIDLYHPFAGLNAYNLNTLFGPITVGDLAFGTGRSYAQFGGIPFDIGLVTLDEVEEISFEAIPNHREFYDADNDGQADIAVWRPSTGMWYIINSSTGTSSATQWGGTGDVPRPGDFDGDGKTDPAVWRPSTGMWYVLNSASGTVTAVQWGASTDTPLSEDFDGDGRADIAVWRPSTGMWYIRNSSDGSIRTVQWGGPGDVPVPEDYDGDGISDIAVYRPSTGQWFIIRSSDGIVVAPVLGGAAGDVPVPADYDGDGKWDLAVWRPGALATYIINSTLTGLTTQSQWGTTNDVPNVGDYDGDGKADLVVFRPSTGMWYILSSSTNTGTAVQWGGAGDTPLE